MLNYLFENTFLTFFIQSFWRDEAFSYLLAKRNIFEILSLTAQDFNPPLYYIILHFWMKIFGSSEIVLRSLSLIFFWATVYVFFLFLIKILKIKSSFFIVIYLILVILNPLLLYYAFEARMYTMFAFFAVLSFYAFYQILIGKYKNNPLIHLISSLLGLYTHYFMILVIINQIIFLLLFNKKKNIFSLMVINYLIIFLFFVPWLIFLLIQKNDFFHSFWIKKISFHAFISLLGIIYTGYEFDFKFYNQSVLKLSLFFMLLIGVSFSKIHGERSLSKRLFYSLLIWGTAMPLIVGIISFFKPIFLPRYLIFSTVGFLLLIVFILERIQIVPRIITLIIIFLFTINYHQVQIKERKKNDVRSIIKEIKTLAKKEDVLYVTNELDFHVAQYYFNENKVYIYGKTYEEIPNYVGKVLIPKEKIINRLPIYPKKAFILTSETHYDIQSSL